MILLGANLRKDAVKFRRFTGSFRDRAWKLAVKEKVHTWDNWRSKQIDRILESA